MASLDKFKGYLIGGGARANQFRVIMNTPATLITDTNSERTSFMIKTAQLPGQTIGEIAVPFRGRNLYIAGDREFETWSTTIINDTDFAVRNLIEQWMNGMNDLVNNTGAIDPGSYQADLKVQQLDRGNDSVLKTYNLIGCFPQAMTGIDLSYETQNEIEQFEVTWRYQHFTASDVSPGVTND